MDTNDDFVLRTRSNSFFAVGCTRKGKILTCVYIATEGDTGEEIEVCRGRDILPAYLVRLPPDLAKAQTQIRVESSQLEILEELK